MITQNKLSNCMSAIVVLTRTPHSELLEFYARFVRLGYDVFVVVDDNNFKAEHTEINFIQIDEAECRGRGFFNLGLQEVVWVFWATSEGWKHACEHLEPQIFLVA
jgi:hypothetical protein